MDGIKLNALCVKAVDYKDGKTLLTLCTVEKGKITAAIKGAKSEKSKLRFAASLLCFGEYILSERNGYYTVTNCALTDGFFEVRSDLIRLYSALSAVEILDKSTVENADISDYIYHALDALKNIAYGKASPLFPLVKFIVAASKLSGYALNLDECMNCGAPAHSGYFDIGLGGGVCLKCASPDSLSVGGECFFLIKELTKNSDASPNGLSDRALTEALQVVYKYFRACADVKINAVNQLLTLTANS
ncbi:MAG: DNA repair protein RecO [Clostridiales bacterium]|jgi:DNA repair protein RecO (recombination protein O)|nr:DNA repair protein RecO [Clostridiales bacterium]